MNPNSTIQICASPLLLLLSGAFCLGADALSATATSRGGVWTSADGRTWVQKDLSDEMWAAGESVAKAAW